MIEPDDQKPQGIEALLDNWVDCHCGWRTGHHKDWHEIQDRWRRHGFGRAC